MQVSLKTPHSKCSINVEWMLFIMSRMCCISCQLLYKSLGLWVKATLICLHGFSVGLTWSHSCDCGLLAVWLGIRGSYIASFMCLVPQLEQLEWPIFSFFVIFHLHSFTWWWASPNEWVLLKPPLMSYLLVFPWPNQVTWSSSESVWERTIQEPGCQNTWFIGGH